MKADEIRKLDPIANRDWNDPVGLAAQVYELTLMMREAAAQLAEMNVHLAKIANPPITVMSNEGFNGYEEVTGGD